MRNTLADIVAHKRAEVAAREALRPLMAVEAAATRLKVNAFDAVLQAATTENPAFILEVKPASPSAGILARDFDIDALLPSYNRFADAMSVLTDNRFFGGSLDLLRGISETSPHPLLCKDFILTEYQVAEARAHGASAVLLIVKTLDDATLRQLHAAILAWGMTPVVEIQNAAELSRALCVDPHVLLINNRNLDTFVTTLETTERLAPHIPAHIAVISASGILDRADIDRLRHVATRFLIGSALMSTPLWNLEAKLADLTGRAPQ